MANGSWRFGDACRRGGRRHRFRPRSRGGGGEIYAQNVRGVEYSPSNVTLPGNDAAAWAGLDVIGAASGPTLSLPESGGTGTYDLALIPGPLEPGGGDLPTDWTCVGVSIKAIGEHADLVAISPINLKFDRDNYSQHLTVTVTVNSNADDDIDAERTVNLQHRTDQNADCLDRPNAVIADVEIVNDDQRGVEYSGAVTMDENGTGEYTVRLTSQPEGAEGDVRVRMRLGDGYDFFGGVDEADHQLVFTHGNWNIRQTVHLKGKYDPHFRGDQTFQVYHAVSGPGYDNLTNAENPTVGVNVDESDEISLYGADFENIDDWGDEVMVDLRLFTGSRPYSKVSVRMSGDIFDARKVTLQPHHYKYGRPITLGFVMDNPVAVATLTANSNDPDYHGLVTEIRASRDANGQIQFEVVAMPKITGPGPF